MALSETGTEVRYESMPYSLDSRLERNSYGQLDGRALMSHATDELQKEISEKSISTWILLITHEDAAVRDCPYVYGGFEANYFQNYGWGFVSTARMGKGRTGNAHGTLTGYHEIATHGIGYGHCSEQDCVHYDGQNTDNILQMKIARLLEEKKIFLFHIHESIYY